MKNEDNNLAIEITKAECEKVELTGTACERNELTRIDFDMLKLVYNMRALTIRQIYDKLYVDKMSIEQFINRLKELEKENIIKIIPFIGNYAIIIEDAGYKILKDTMLVRELLDDNNKNKKGYNTLKENLLQPKAINHQIHLNEFVLQFEDTIKSLPIDIPYEYFDEKNASKYVYMRPDGLLTTKLGKNRIDFFLEMDMATESLKQLEEKWARYKNFINSKYFYNSKERIVVLFILANTDKIEARRRLVLKSILKSFEDFNSRFDIYIGEKNELLKLAFNLILNKPDKRFFMKNLLSDKGIESNMVTNLCKLSYSRNKIYCYFKVGKNIILYDDYTDEDVSILDKMKHAFLNIMEIKEQTEKRAYYLVMTNDIEKLFDDLKSLEIRQLDNFIFTTPERIKTLPLNEALFTINSEGAISHFLNEDLSELTFEQILGED